MYESRLRKRKVKEQEEVQYEKEVEKATPKKLKTSVPKKSTRKKDKLAEVEVLIEEINEPDLDLTKTCPNEVCNCETEYLCKCYFTIYFEHINPT